MQFLWTFGRGVSLVFLTVLSSLVPFTAAAYAQTEVAKLTASDAMAFDEFGFSAAIDGNTLVVGAWQSDNGVPGSAYVFVRSGTTWTEQAKLTASDGAPFDEFGVSVSVSGDTTVVGVPHDDHAAGTNPGSAYVFVRSGTTWTEQAKLTASDASAFDIFGFSVSIDGDTIVVGSRFDDHLFLNAGSAYVFVRSGTTWTEQARLTASDAAEFDLFASSVSISGDTLVAAARWDDHAGGTNAGSAYVFVRSGTTWTEQAKLTASDAAGGDEFGISVSISANTIGIGAFHDDHAGGTNAGSAYVFVRSGTTWTEQAKLTASDAGAGDEFANFNSLSLDVNRVVVGAHRHDLLTPEAIDLLLALIDTVVDLHLQQGIENSLVAILEAALRALEDMNNNNDGAAINSLQAFIIVVEAQRGIFISEAQADTLINAALNIIAVLSGADFPNAGAAYVFVRSGTTWTEQAKLIASDAAPGDEFGFSVAMDGMNAAVGAYRNDDAGSNSGSIYVFDH